MTIDDLIAQTKAERDRLIERMNKKYHRGDAEELMQHDMFISIFEKGKSAKTQEEKDQVLLDHGWTLTKKDGTVLRPSSNKEEAYESGKDKS